MVYRRGTPRNGLNFLLLYAYGSYGYSAPVTSSFPRLSLLDLCVIYVIAHIDIDAGDLRLLRTHVSRRADELLESGEVRFVGQPLIGGGFGNAEIERSLAANRSRSPNKPENAATTQPRRCRGANATSRSTAWD